MLHWFHCSAKQKTSFVSRATKDAGRKREVFRIRYFSKTKSKPAKKIHGDVFLFN